MPKVFATGFMVGLIEWACITCINPFLDSPREQTVGTDVRLTHSAATSPSMTVTVKTRLERIEGRKLSFSIVAHDEIDLISEGTHERFIIDAAKFGSKVTDKYKRRA